MVISKGKNHRFVPIDLDDLPEMLTCSQVGQYMQVCDNTISKWVREGKIKACRIPNSRTYRISKNDLITFINDCRGGMNG